MVKADVELGGTDQLFNISNRTRFSERGRSAAAGRFSSPILEGLDGSKKMSKSLGNFVAIKRACRGDVRETDEHFRRFDGALLSIAPRTRSAS